MKEREERFKRILKKTIGNNQDLLLELSQRKTDRNISTTYPKVRNRKLRISKNHRELTEEYRNTKKRVQENLRESIRNHLQRSLKQRSEPETG